MRDGSGSESVEDRPPELRTGGLLDQFAEADVLIVDDNPANVALLHAILARAGLRRLRVYVDPRAAVGSLDRRPDLALVDLHMPHLDGFDVLQRLAESAAGSYLPALVLTADVSAESLRRALESGASDYLTKPFDATEVQLRVRNLLHTSSLHKALRQHNGRLRAELDVQQARRQIELARQGESQARVAAVLHGRQIDMVYQPVVEVASGSMVGVEALARFPAQPVRPPDIWFAEADGVGLGLDLQLLAIKRSLRALEDLPTQSFLAVNLTPAVLLDRDQRLLRMSEASLDRVVLELTEHTRVEDYEALNHAIKPFRAAGARLAVDDTGAGYAGLQHLLALNPDLVKLDLSLTRGIDRDPTRRALATALVCFGQDTGATVVAEGVETLEEFETLRALHVPWAQGYYMARPQPLPNVLDTFC